MEGSERNVLCPSSVAPRLDRLRAIAGPLALAAIAGGAGWIAARSAQALAAIELGPGARDRVPAMSVFAIVALLSLSILRPAAKRLVGRRGATVVTLAAIALSPLVVAAALVRLDLPIVSQWWGARVGDPSQRFAPAFAAACAAGVIIAVIACGRSVPRVSRRFELAASIAIAAGALLFIAATARSAGSVDPSRFVASLPIVGLVHPIGANEIRDAGGLSVRRECMRTSIDRTRAEACTLIISADGIEQRAAASFDVRPSSTLTLRRDEAHGFFVLDEDGRRRRALDGSGRPVDIAVADVDDRLGPPTEWILVAGFGLGIAAIAFLRGRRARHAAELVAAGVEGMLDGSRFIHVDGDAPLRAPDAFPKRTGPVVVIARAPRGVRSIYRADDSQRPAAIVLGAKGDLVARFRETASASCALSITAVAITGAPLVAALVRGLVV